MRSVFVLASATAIVAGSILATAQNPPAAPAQGGARGPQEPMSFFVTSTAIGNGGNLGGLAGADAHCAKLAAASKITSAPGRTWRAYLSTQGPNAVNARDRIGTGPWANARGGIVAQNVGHLHGDTVEQAQIGNNLSRGSVLTENNTQIKGAGDLGEDGKPLNQHDILTGTKSDGRAFPAGEDRTCSNWTSNAEGVGGAGVGHFDRTGGGNTSWNAAHATRGCSQPNVMRGGGAGYFYCFAAN
jgi:hypothetical protein